MFALLLPRSLIVIFPEPFVADVLSPNVDVARRISENDIFRCMYIKYFCLLTKHFFNEGLKFNFTTTIMKPSGY